LKAGSAHSAEGSLVWDGKECRPVCKTYSSSAIPADSEVNTGTFRFTTQFASAKLTPTSQFGRRTGGATAKSAHSVSSVPWLSSRSKLHIPASSCKAPAYQSLLHYFSTVTLREMYQGLPYTLAKELILVLHASQNIGLGILILVGYPIALAETRMKAMSSHRGLQSYRYTNRIILGKIPVSRNILLWTLLRLT